MDPEGELARSREIAERVGGCDVRGGGSRDVAVPEPQQPGGAGAHDAPAAVGAAEDAEAGQQSREVSVRGGFGGREQR